MTTQIFYESDQLIEHAKRELTMLECAPHVIETYLDIIKAYWSLDSGIDEVINILRELANGLNLSPLTDDPDEWYNVGLFGHQNVRNSFAFSMDHGKTYTLMYEQTVQGRKHVYHSVPSNRTKES